MSRIGVFVAHPDDELLVFGPVLYNMVGGEYDVTVVGCVDCGPTRSAQFVKSVRNISPEFHTHFIPDAPPDDWDIEDGGYSMGQTFHQSLLDYKAIAPDFDAIYTHDPIHGDVGAHLHHKVIGRVVCVAYNGLTRILCPYSEGHGRCEVEELDKAAYHVMVQNFATVYGQNREYLDGKVYALKARATFIDNSANQLDYLSTDRWLPVQGELDGGLIVQQVVKRHSLDIDCRNVRVYHRDIFERYRLGELDSLQDQQALVVVGLIEDRIDVLLTEAGFHPYSYSKGRVNTRFKTGFVPRFTIHSPITVYLRLGTP